MEGGVDGDFEVAAFGRVGRIGFGEAHYDLEAALVVQSRRFQSSEHTLIQ